MKKLTTLLTSAILVFGSIAVTSCSNGSDDNTAKNLAAASANTNSGTSTTNNNNNNNDTNNDNNNNNNNNTNNDNNNTNNNTPVVTQTNKYLFAEAVEGGILFTIKTLPTEKRPDWVGIYDENGSALIVNSWNDKTQDWTGLYPFISSGEKRIFTLYTDTGISEKVTVTAKGGKGSLTIPEGLKPTLNVTSNNITVEIPATYSKSLLPSGATANNLQFEIYTEDGTPFGWGHIYDLKNNPTSFVFTNDFNEIKNNWKTKYNDKKIFTSVFYNFTTNSGSYRLIKIESDSQTPTAWQTNN